MGRIAAPPTEARAAAPVSPLGGGVAPPTGPTGAGVPEAPTGVRPKPPEAMDAAMLTEAGPELPGI